MGKKKKSVAVIDGQGGGIGSTIIKQLREVLGEEIEIICLGTNAMATVFLLTFMDQADRKRLQTITPYGPEIHGTFATRSPNRPNPIGLSVVKLTKIKGCRPWPR